MREGFCAADREPVAPTPETTPEQAAPVPGLLDLQRRAGNRAVVELLHRSAAAPPAGTVQRSTGFEFELEVPWVSRGDDLPGDHPAGMRETYEWVTGEGELPKYEIDNLGYPDDPTGFKIVTDNGTVGDRITEYRAQFANDCWVNDRAPQRRPGIIEFVTSPFDERADDYETDLATQMGDVREIVEGFGDPGHLSQPLGGRIAGIPQTLHPPLTDPNHPAGHLPDEPLRSDVAAAENAMRVASHLRSNMQATVGMPLETVADFVEGEDHAVIEDYGYNVQVRARAMFDAIRPTVLLGLQTYEGEHDTVVPERERLELEGFLRVVLQYVAGDVLFSHLDTGDATMKNITPFWIRMDLSTYRTFLGTDAQGALAVMADAISALIITAHGTLSGEFPPQEDEEGPITNLPPIAEFLENVFKGDSDDIGDDTRWNHLDVIEGENRGLPIELRTVTAHPTPDQFFATALALTKQFRAWQDLEGDDSDD